MSSNLTQDGSQVSVPRPFTARDALDRTLRLMRDELRPESTDERLIHALRDTRVTVMADAETLRSPAAQTAFITTVLLLLRSGIAITLDAPHTQLAAPQPPLVGTELITALLAAARDLIPGIPCERLAERVQTDAIVIVGNTPAPAYTSAFAIRVSGGALHGRIDTEAAALTARHGRATRSSWTPSLGVPFGALVAAGLAATEVHKLVMRSLRDLAMSPRVFDELFAASPFAEVSLDPHGDITVDQLNQALDLASVDMVSGGAITHSVLYTLARMPGIRGSVRVIEPDVAEVSNLNRYALLLRSDVDSSKAHMLSELVLGGITVEPIPIRYDRMTPVALGGLADAVVVGVDHIPTRWAVQRARPQWLGVGATSHYAAMSSEHCRGISCARCLHPSDAPDLGPIPTIAFVSHWAGVLLAWRLVRHRVGVPLRLEAQYDFFTPLRADLPAAMWRSIVGARSDCRWCAHLRRGAA